MFEMDGCSNTSDVNVMDYAQSLMLPLALCCCANSRHIGAAQCSAMRASSLC